MLLMLVIKHLDSLNNNDFPKNTDYRAIMDLSELV